MIRRSSAAAAALAILAAALAPLPACRLPADDAGVRRYPRDLPLDAAIAVFDRRSAATARLRATFALAEPSGRASRGALLLERPDRLRATIAGALGSTEVDAHAAGELVTAHFPARGAVLRTVLDRLDEDRLGFPVRSIVRGVLVARSRGAREARREEDGRIRVERWIEGRLAATTWLAADTLLPERTLLHDGSGRARRELLFTDWRTTPAGPWHFRVVLRTAPEAPSTVLVLEEVSFEETSDATAFDVIVPDGTVTLESLDELEQEG